jgi:hypothetical protein
MSRRETLYKNEDFKRRAASVLRFIRENPGRGGSNIAMCLGWRDADGRTVRECVRYLRDTGEPITLAESCRGYILLDNDGDEHGRAQLVKHHRERTRSQLIDHAALMRQIGKMTAAEIATACLFDLLLPREIAQELDNPPVSMADLAKLPAAGRAGVFNLMMTFLQGLADDPVAFRAERAAIGGRFGKMFYLGQGRRDHRQGEGTDAAGFDLE